MTLKELKYIKTIDMEHCRKSLVEISKIKFKKLSWWQKIINKISWTWKKTKIDIKTIKENNTKDFENLFAKSNANKTLTTFINEPLQKQSKPIILPTSKPWDQWIIEKKPKFKNDNNLFRCSSTDSAISSLSCESEENDYYILDIDKILREIDGDSSVECSDLESSTESFSQQFNYPISRSSSNDSGLDCGTPKLVSTNPFDDENYCQPTTNQNHFNYDTLVDTAPLISTSASKLKFS